MLRLRRPEEQQQRHGDQGDGDGGAWGHTQAAGQGAAAGAAVQPPGSQLLQREGGGNMEVMDAGLLGCGPGAGEQQLGALAALVAFLIKVRCNRFCAYRAAVVQHVRDSILVHCALPIIPLRWVVQHREISATVRRLAGGCGP